MPGLLFLILTPLYLSSIAPDITWMHDGVDGGDLASAAATNGVAHPSGYPTYLLIASLIQKAPVGTLAFRTNLLSLIAIQATTIVTYLLTQKSIAGPPTFQKRAAGGIAALALGVSPAIWGNALVTEVYALHIFFISTILLLSFSPASKGNGSLSWAPTITGLSLGNHLTSIFMAPVLLWESSLKGFVLHWKEKLAIAALIATTAAAMYSTLLIRANTGSPVNWGAPADLPSLWWLVSGQLYQYHLIPADLSTTISRLPAWGRLLVDQFGFSFLALGLVGLLWARPSRAAILGISLWIFISNTLFAVVYSAPDSYQYLLPAYLCVSLWISWGIYKLFSLLERRRTLQFLAMLSLVILLGLRTYQLFPEQTARYDQSAAVFGQQILDEAPRDAVILTDDDHETFTLWYFHFALHQRQDLIILSEGLMSYGWYQATIRDYYNLTQVDELNARAESRPFCEISNFTLVCSEGENEDVEN